MTVSTWVRGAAVSEFSQQGQAKTREQGASIPFQERSQKFHQGRGEAESSEERLLSGGIQSNRLFQLSPLSITKACHQLIKRAWMVGLTQPWFLVPGREDTVRLINWGGGGKGPGAGRDIQA